MNDDNFEFIMGALIGIAVAILFYMVGVLVYYIAEHKTKLNIDRCLQQVDYNKDKIINICFKD